MEIELSKQEETSEQERCPTPKQEPKEHSPFVRASTYTEYLQILDFLQEISSPDQWGSPKELYGRRGLALIFDQLLLFVARKCTATEFKRLHSDCHMFM